jgi:two-component system sensor histidine kinase UhpB
VTAAAVGIGEALLIIAIVIERRRRAHAQVALATNYRQLHEMSARLILAEEQERTRIARDLHDDLGQRVASMAIGLSTLRRRLPESAAPFHDDVASLQREASRISTDLRHVSHELHPGLLQQFGLVEALRLRAEELHAQSGLTITVEAVSVWPTLPDAVTVCLYRVAQEALGNAVAHSGGKSIAVRMVREARLTCSAMRKKRNGIQLTQRNGIQWLRRDTLWTARPDTL